jgi:ABC-type transport system involved in cytochrome c biogenesis ATPase subunit
MHPTASPIDPATPSPLQADGLHLAAPRWPRLAGWTHAFPAGLTLLRGAHGSGKTTLLRLLAGDQAPDAGTLRLGDLQATADPAAWQRAVCWTDTSDTALDPLDLPTFFDRAAARCPAWDAGVVDGAVQAQGLAPFMTRQLFQLSTGSRRKLALVVAVASRAPVVLLDEPLGALDARSVAWVQQRLLRAGEGHDGVWVVASHADLGPAQAVAHTIDLPDPD